MAAGEYMYVYETSWTLLQLMCHVEMVTSVLKKSDIFTDLRPRF